MILLAAAAFVVQTGTADARQVTLSAPQAVIEIDAGKLKGEPARMAWSQDRTEFYVQAIERDRRGNLTTRHYVISAADKSIKGLDAEPPWASRYWLWKSGQSSPAAPAFKIDVDGPRKRSVRATSAPTGGALAKGGGADPLEGTTVSDVAGAADQTQMQTVYTLKVKSETLGEWINEPVTPGSNFTWAPAPMRLLAFSKREGGPVIVLDETGRKQQLSGMKAAVLPAWSSDGGYLAWLERKDKKKYELIFAEVSAK